MLDNSSQQSSQESYRTARGIDKKKCFVISLRTGDFKFVALTQKGQSESL